MTTESTNAAKNTERRVKCPAEGCDATPPARGLHLHVMRSNDEAHGPQGETPAGLTIEHAETVGEVEVEVNYPSKRNNEQVSRQCPYCELPFTGKQGLSIHFGQVVGRKNHPKDREDFPDPEDCPVVHVDEDGNTLEVADGNATMPSTKRRQKQKTVGEITEQLREEGQVEQADALEHLLETMAV